MIFNHYASGELNGVKVMTEEDFNRLLKSGLVKDISLRNIEIRDKYKELKEKGVSPGNAIEEIRKSYMYLQYDTIMKIIYSKRR